MYTPQGNIWKERYVQQCMQNEKLEEKLEKLQLKLDELKSEVHHNYSNKGCTDWCNNNSYYVYESESERLQ